MATLAGNRPIIKALNIAATVLLALWVVSAGSKLVYLGAHAAPSFDGAMNLEVARSLSSGEGYRRLFHDREAFPHEIQTNAPFVIPAAIVYYFFGAGIPQSSVVNVGYFLLVALASSVLMLSIRRSVLSATLGPLALIITPGLMPLGFSGYGEIPALAWMLVATAYYFFPRNEPGIKNRFLFTGGLLALSYLTKTVMLIGVAAFAIGLALEFVFHRRKAMSAWLYDMLAMAAGFSAPVVAYEAWKAFSLGGWKEWLGWWAVELGQIGKQAGVNKLADHHLGSIPIRVSNHLHVLANHYGLPYWLTAAWVALILLVTALALVRAIRDERYLATFVVLCAASAYLVWWLGITVDSRTWLRRIIDGMICANLGIFLALRHPVQRSIGARQLLRIFAAACALVVPAMLLAQSTLNVARRKPADNSALLQVSKEVENLPANAYLFGVGWWSNPDVAVLSGRHILNFNQIVVSRLDATRPAYVIKEPIAAYIGMINHAFSMYGLQVSPALSYGVYRIPGFTPRAMKAEQAPIKTAVSDTDDYPYVEGTDKPVPGFGIWLSSDNAILLNHGNSRMLKLTGYAVAQDQYLYATSPRVTISFDGCSAPAESVPTEQIFTLRFELPERCGDLAQDPLMVRIQVDNIINYAKTNGDFRSLSILTKKIGFEELE